MASPGNFYRKKVALPTLVPGMIIKPVSDRAIISELCRVLYVSEPMDRVVLIPVEIISFCSRVFALAIRLFANVLAGHILIFALLSMVVLFGWVALPVVFMAVGIYFFEIFMSLLQAYIFTLLSAIFISQMAYEGH